MAIIFTIMKAIAFSRRNCVRIVALLVGVTAGGVFQALKDGAGEDRTASIVRVSGAVKVVDDRAALAQQEAPEAGEGLENVLTEPMIRTSLDLLAQNGADLTKPMPSRHRVIVKNRATAAVVAAWAAQNGFETTAPQLFHEHGGVEHFALELVRTAVPVAEVIHEEARAVYAAVTRIDGSFYQTWEGAVVR